MGATGLNSTKLLAPALIVYTVFLIYPAFASLAISFTNWDGVSSTKEWVGIDNYRAIFLDDPVARLALKNSLMWTAVCVSIPVALGLSLAVALNRRVAGRTFLRGVFYLPGVLPMVAVGLAWAWIYNPYLGLLNDLLKAAGLRRFAHAWLSDARTALAATLLCAVWQGTGFPMLLYLAGLQSIPPSLYEAAELDGATRWSTFRYITLPSLWETHVVVISLAFLASMRSFDLIYVMTYGGPGRSTQVLATWMFFNTFQYNRVGYGSAIAWIITAISLLVTVPYVRRLSRQ